MICTIDGNIGVGKTTLLKELEKHPKITVVYEPVDEWVNCKDTVTGQSIFELYYQNKKRYAFLFQIMALQTRFENIIKISKENPDKIIVCERSIYTDIEIFAKLMHEEECLSDVEMQIYNKLHTFMLQISNLKINKIIYLRALPDVCISRIRKRERKGEEHIKLEYIKKLHKAHDEWLLQCDNVSVINADSAFDTNLVLKCLGIS